MNPLAILVVPLGYLLGSFPSGYLAGQWCAGVDIRQLGSGSTGATNVLRQVGKGPALVVFLVDVFKGSAAVIVARGLLGAGAYGWLVAAGLAALAGHIWPIWLGGKGGKAVATGFGMLLGLVPAVGLACLGVFLTSLALSRIVSISSVLAAASLPLLMAGAGAPGAYLGLGVVAAVMVIWRHRSNLARLLKGEEPRLGQKD
ncbi:glycerol-3-phosphate 1-O-acyltransferase PlsY [Synechococcus sp. MIT S9452]|uniref:glycerol-3-phosphate 1-O-acyltransferase PlsY n=1 Tax=Synechococcus sp. MIT S9452 TaxID=3082546 RepID=UPI0039A688C4